MGVQKLIQPGNVLTTRDTCLRHSGLAPARRCLPDPLQVRETGKSEGKTNQLHEKGVGGFPSTTGLGCITHLPRAPLPFAKLLWGGGCSSIVELALCNLLSPSLPLAKGASPLSKTPCGEPSLPFSPHSWYHCQRSCVVCLCAVLCISASHAPQVLRNLPLIRPLLGFVREESEEYFPSPQVGVAVQAPVAAKRQSGRVRGRGARMQP